MTERIPDGMAASPFYNPENRLARDKHAFAWVNQFPVTDGHVMILPKREIASFFDLNRDEIVSHMNLAARAVKQLDKYYKPSGYIMGWNVGVAAGQSVGHAHMHIMPCFDEFNQQQKLNRRGGGLRMSYLGDLPDFYYRARGQVEDPKNKKLKRAGLCGDVEILKPFAPIAREHYLIYHPGMSNRDQRPYHRPNRMLEVVDAIHELRDRQWKDMTHPPNGYNISCAMGLAAGQIYNTNMWEILGRWKDDTPNPRGGITTCFPNLSDYYKPENKGVDVPVKTPVKLKFQRI